MPLVERAIACAKYADELSGGDASAKTGDSVGAVDTLIHAIAYIAIHQPHPQAALKAIAETLVSMADDMPPILAEGVGAS